LFTQKKTEKEKNTKTSSTQIYLHPQKRTRKINVIDNTKSNELFFTFLKRGDFFCFTEPKNPSENVFISRTPSKRNVVP